MQEGSERFDLLAAIDLRGGRVVRLRQGDFGRETAYADDPVAVALGFVDRGVRWLHVVDLDGARDGRSTHADVIERVIATVGSRAAVEVAGGLRTSLDVARVLRAGAARAVIGTAALSEPRFVAALVAAHGADAIAVALDVRDGMAVGSGWVPGSVGVPLDEGLARLTAAGVRWIEVTAIARDGTLGGPDTTLLRHVTTDGRVKVVAAGGIAAIEDLLAVRDLGCAGAIVGRAFYDGTLDPAKAIAAAGRG